MNSTDTSLWKRTLQSLGRIDYRLFGTLILMSLLPTIYLTVRINFLGNLPETGDTTLHHNSLG
jgi:hypothetical protein